MIKYFAVGLVTVSSAHNVTASDIVVKVTFIVETPYSAGTTIDVGYAGSTSALLSSSTNDVIPGTAGSYDSSIPVVWANTDQPVVVTIGGSPSVGAGHMVVEHATPQN